MIKIYVIKILKVVCDEISYKVAQVFQQILNLINIKPINRNSTTENNLIVKTYSITITTITTITTTFTTITTTSTTIATITIITTTITTTSTTIATSTIITTTTTLIYIVVHNFLGWRHFTGAQPEPLGFYYYYYY